MLARALALVLIVPAALTAQRPTTAADVERVLAPQPGDGGPGVAPATQAEVLHHLALVPTQPGLLLVVLHDQDPDPQGDEQQGDQPGEHHRPAAIGRLGRMVRRHVDLTRTGRGGGGDHRLGGRGGGQGLPGAAVFDAMDHPFSDQRAQHPRQVVAGIAAQFGDLLDGGLAVDEVQHHLLVFGELARDVLLLGEGEDLGPAADLAVDRRLLGGLLIAGPDQRLDLDAQAHRGLPDRELVRTLAGDELDARARPPEADAEVVLDHRLRHLIGLGLADELPPHQVVAGLGPASHGGAQFSLSGLVDLVIGPAGVREGGLQVLAEVDGRRIAFDKADLQAEPRPSAGQSTGQALAMQGMEPLDEVGIEQHAYSARLLKAAPTP